MILRLAACASRPQAPDAMDENERAHVTAAVTAAMQSFEQAERGRNAEALINHFAAVPEFSTTQT
jgi:hypothetical protein